MKNKFIFSFKNVVIFVFCFVLLGSLVLSLSLSKKVSGLDVSEPVGGWESLEEPAETPTTGTSISNNAPVDDINAAPSPSDVDVQIGDTWTGPSGQIYIATTPSAATVANGAAVGVTVIATWVPVSTTGGDGDGDGEKFSCKICTWDDKCSVQYRLTKCDDECSTDADCQESSTITPAVDPSQAQYRCRQCRCH